MASLSTCHLCVLPWMANLGQLINIARFIEKWMFVCVRVSVCVSFNHVEFALRIYYHSLFHTPFTFVFHVGIREKSPLW